MSERLDILRGLASIGEFSNLLKEKYPSMKETCEDWLAIVLGAMSLIKQQDKQIRELQSKVWTYEAFYNTQTK